MKKRGCSPDKIFSCKGTVTKSDTAMGIHRSLKQNEVHRQTPANTGAWGADRVESPINWERLLMALWSLFHHMEKNT